MSERATPETDAAAMPWYGERDAVVGDFARKLERQRDEAREELLKQRVENNHNWQAVADLEQMIKLARELRNALYAVYNLPPNCSCAIGNNEMGAWHDVGIALGKAKEVLG